MRKLHDYLDYKILRIVTDDGEVYEGFTVNVDYAEDNASGEDELVIETKDGRFIGFAESKIKSVDIVK